MTQASAAWIAAHALAVFIVLPALAALAAVAVARAASRLSPPGRRRARAAGLCLLLAMFALLAAAVATPGRVLRFDDALADALGAAMPAPLLWALSWFTALGDRNFLIALSVCMVLGLLYAGRRRLALFCVAATAGGGILNWLLKHGFARIRPDFTHDYATVSGWSFPSGHASGAMAVYGAACCLAWRLAPPSWRMPSLAATAALVCAIGLSRVLLHVHFASDVAAGLAVSLAWLALCAAAIR